MSAYVVSTIKGNAIFFSSYFLLPFSTTIFPVVLFRIAPTIWPYERMNECVAFLSHDLVDYISLFSILFQLFSFFVHLDLPLMYARKLQSHFSFWPDSVQRFEVDGIASVQQEAEMRWYPYACLSAFSYHLGSF